MMTATPQRAAKNGDGAVVPQGWRFASLEEVASLQRGRFSPRPRSDPRYYGGSYPFIQTGDVESSDGYIRTHKQTLNEDGLAVSKLFTAGTLIISIAANIGSVGILAFDSCMPDSLVGITAREGVADNGYLYFALRYLKPALQKLAPAMAQANLSLRLLAPTRIRLPEFHEQRRIAARLRGQLAEVAQARAAIAAQLAAAQALPSAHLRAVFQSTAAQHWPHLRLGDAAEIVGGMQKTPDRAPRQFHKQFLTVRNVQHGRLDLNNVERFEVTAAEFERLRLLKGDLLLVEGNGSQSHIGRNALFNEDGEWIHQNHIIRARLNRAILLSEFVSHYLNSAAGRAQLLEKAKTTTGLFTLSTGKIAALQIPTPPLAEQRAIAAKVEAENREAADLANKLTGKLAALDQLPAALLREAFGGAG